MDLLYKSRFLAILALLLPHLLPAQYHPIAVTEDVILQRTTTIDTDKVVGAIPGSAATNAFGAATYTIPLPVAPGTLGMQPELALTYNSHGGNGPFGRGWSLSGLSAISRTGQDQLHDGAVSPISLSTDDRFNFDGQRLLRQSGAAYGSNGCIYDTEQLSHASIEHFGTLGNGPEYFIVTTAAGNAMEYRRSAEARVAANGTAVIWRLSKVTDRSGNYMTYTYEEDGQESRLMRIDYTGNDNLGLAPYNAVRFQYVTRATTDQDEYYIAGALRRNKKIIDRIYVEAEQNMCNFYLINYERREYGTAETGFNTYLREITLHGEDYSSLNTTIFKYGDLADESEYTDHTWEQYNNPHPPHLDWVNDEAYLPQMLFSKADFDGDGRDEVVAARFTQDEFFNQIAHLDAFVVLRWNGTKFDHCAEEVSIPDAAITGLPNLPSAAVLTTGDFNGDGRDDVLTPILGGSALMGVRIRHAEGGCDFDDVPYNAPTLYNRVNLQGNFLTSGDFNADGLMDYLVITHRWDNPDDYKVYFSSPELEIINHELSSPDISPLDLANATRLLAADTDGDGAAELLVLKNPVEVYTLDVSATSITERTHQILSIDNDVLIPGDYNGDGLLDLWGRNMQTLNSWRIHYGNGIPSGPDAGFTAVDLPEGGQFIPADIHVFSADMDGDGKSELIYMNEHSGSVTMCSGGLGDFTHRSIWTGPFEDHGDWRSPRMAYDCNGDGHQDLVAFQSTFGNTLMNRVYFLPEGPHGTIPGGHGGRHGSLDPFRA